MANACLSECGWGTIRRSVLVSRRRPRAERKNASFAPFASCGPRVAQVAAEPVRRLLAERDDALLAALAAADVDELLLEVDVAEVEADGLGAAQPGGVDELDERAVPQRDRALSFERFEHALDLGGRRSVRQAPCAARARRASGTRSGPSACRRKARTAASLRLIVAGASFLPRRRRPEPRDVLGEHADVDRVEPRAALLEPGAELPDVAAVRVAGRLAQRRRGEEAVGGGASVHASTVPRRSKLPFSLPSPV